MGLNLRDIPVKGGGWFRPDDHANAVAILLEVTGFERQRPTNYGPKDSAIADVTIFADMTALKEGRAQVTKGQRIEHTILARDLETIVGGATIATLAQVQPNKPGAKPAWIWRNVTDSGIRNLVIEYAAKRDAAAEAAIADAPDFD